MLPLILAVSDRWKCFAAAAATVILLTVATTLAFGVAVWPAFARASEFTRSVVLEQGNTGWYKIQSVFSWARMWGAPVPPAYALQGIAIVAVGAALARLWRSAAAFPLKAAALCIGAILATRYSLDYNMMVLAPALAFFAVDGFARGFRPWEKTILSAVWLVPRRPQRCAVSLIPLGVSAMALFVLILRRSGISALATAFIPHRGKIDAEIKNAMTSPR